MTTTESYGCDKHGEDAYQGCAMCDLETLRERLHEAELVAASWKREAELNEQAANESSGYAKRLAEAERLLFALRDGIAVADFGDWNLLDQVDSFRSGDSIVQFTGVTP